MDKDTTVVTPAGPDDTTTTDTTKPAGPDVNTDAPAGPDTDTKAEENSLVQSLRKEAASARIKAKEYETQIETLRKENEELRSASGPSTDKNPEVATLTRQVQSLTQQLQKYETDAKAQAERVRQKTLQAALSQVASEAQLNEPQTAIRLLSDAANVAADDAVVFKVKDDTGKDIEVEANAENLKRYRLLPAIYFPAEGVAGTGAKSVKTPAGATVDLNRARTDAKYYQENREAIKAALAAQRKAK